MHKCPDIECHDEVKKIGEALKVWKRISFVFGAPALGVALVVWGTVTFALPEKYCTTVRAIDIEKAQIEMKSDVKYMRLSFDNLITELNDYKKERIKRHNK